MKTMQKKEADKHICVSFSLFPCTLDATSSKYQQQIKNVKDDAEYINNICTLL